MGRINSKNKGSNYERDIVSLFKELGWVDACSSRSESKTTDDSGVDACYTHPFQLQMKAVEKLGSVHEILKKMPKGEGLYNLVMHKRNNKGTIVSMGLLDFIDLLNKLIRSEQIIPKGKPTY